MSRREMLRVSAMLAGAAAVQGTGVSAKPSSLAPAHLHAQTGTPVANAELTVPFLPFGQEVALDPHRAVNWGPFWVMLPNVWSGLLGFDENGGVVLDLAESIDISPDGLVYTFFLRPGLTYANQRPVRADHFVASWRRALDPLNLSPMASFMEAVAGYTAYIRRESDDLGVRAVDERTIEIQLSEPYSYFPANLATFVWAVIDPDALAEGADDVALRDAGAGGWRFTEFLPNDRFVMEPNPSYWDGTSPSLSKLIWPILDGPDASGEALSLYEQDTAVSADVPLSLQPRVTGDATLSSELVRLEQQASTLAIGLDFAQAPFNDVRVRRALAAGIDRERWATDIWEGTFVPAAAFTPPVIRALSAYEPPALIPFEPETARALLAEATAGAETQLPEVVYYLPAEQAAAESARAEAMLGMIGEHTGMTIRLDSTKTQEQLDALYRDQGGRQFELVWWWSATDTPSLLSYACRTDAPAMAGVFNWSADIADGNGFQPGADAARFEEATRQADFSQDQGERNALYREAEQLLLQNAVYIPLGHWVQAFVQKPWLQGARQGPWSGRLPVRFDRNVVVVEQ